MKEIDLTALRDTLRRNKAVLLVIALGAALMLLPTSPSGSGRGEDGGFAAEEERIARVVSHIRGVGECWVLLQPSGEGEKGGAVIVCDGADSATVRLDISRAVSAYTGLSSDRIIILKSKQGGT